MFIKLIPFDSFSSAPHFLFDPILGPVLIVGPVDIIGDTTDVTDKARRVVKKVAREAGATMTVFDSGVIQTDHLTDEQVDTVDKIMTKGGY